MIQNESIDFDKAKFVVASLHLKEAASILINYNNEVSDTLMQLVDWLKREYNLDNLQEQYIENLTEEIANG